MVDGPVPDTAMDTKSDERDPGPTDTTPLTADERALLDRLRDGGGTDVVGTPAEESPAFAAAVAADSPVPPDRPDADRPGTDRPGADQAGTDRPGADQAGTDRPDPLDPVFREPDR